MREHGRCWGRGVCIEAVAVHLLAACSCFTTLWWCNDLWNRHGTTTIDTKDPGTTRGRFDCLQHPQTSLSRTALLKAARMKPKCDQLHMCLQDTACVAQPMGSHACTPHTLQFSCRRPTNCAIIAPHVLEGQCPVRHRQDVWWASVCAVHVRRGHEEPSATMVSVRKFPLCTAKWKAISPVYGELEGKPVTKLACMCLCNLLICLLFREVQFNYM